jgi:dephospho-CoA kinase
MPMPHPHRAARRLPVIGVTGGAGAGKSLVASLFARWGGLLISGDEIGKRVVDGSACLRRRLVKAFGPGILKGGKIRRSVLAKRAFADRTATELLNRLVHPLLIRELNREIGRAARSSRYRAVVVDAALLVEWGQRQVHWEYLVGVWAPATLRRERLRARGWTDDQIRGRMRGQLPWCARRRVIDCVVKNDGSLAMLERRARLCWERIISYS